MDLLSQDILKAVLKEQHFSYSESFNYFGPSIYLKKGRNNVNWCSHMIEEKNFNSKVGLILVARMPVVMLAS